MATNQYDVVYIDAGANQLAQAVCNSTEVAANAVGITVSDCDTISISQSVQWAGEVTTPNWSWSPGDRLYVSTVAGQITNIKPTTSGYYIKEIGFAISDTTIVVDLQKIEQIP